MSDFPVMCVVGAGPNLMRVAPSRVQEAWGSRTILSYRAYLSANGILLSATEETLGFVYPRAHDPVNTKAIDFVVDVNIPGGGLFAKPSYPTTAKQY